MEWILAKEMNQTRSRFMATTSAKEVEEMIILYEVEVEEHNEAVKAAKEGNVIG